jgi:hypothetical protein
MGYEINYNDDKLKSIESEKNAALNEVSQTYDGMINESDKFYQAQIDASKEWKDTQSELQQAQTDFTIEQIEQEREQTEKDYKKEQTAAYVDWQKQSGQYGVNAEQTAASGLQRSGYSESSQVAMYNTYQNRVSVARETFNQALLGFTNAIKDAQLQNSSALAEIAFQAFERQAELALQGFQYKNSLLIEKANKKTETEERYYTRYQDRVAQLYEDRAFNEQVRQYNASLAEEQRQFNASLAEEQRQYSAKNSGSGGSGVISKDTADNNAGSDNKTKTKDDVVKAKKDTGDLASVFSNKEELERIHRALGMSITASGRVDAIKKMYEKGQITQAQARELLAYYTQ